MTTFRLPDLGEGLQEAEIVSWHVAPGDNVVADQPLLAVETAKAVVEIPAPQAGRILQVHGAPGEMIAVGAELVEFADAAAQDAGAIVGTLPRETTDAAPAAKPPVRPSPRPAVRAAPAVRSLAHGLGIDLAAVEATGPDGAITAADVERAATTVAAAAAEAKPLRGVRRAMAANMVRAGAEAVLASLTDEADIDGWPADADPTIRLIRAIAAGCAAEPILNAWYDAPRGELRVHRKIDLGIAMDTGDGLFVPVLRNVAAREDRDLRQGLEAMKRDVAARAVPPAELLGQTLTLSNFGTIAGRHAALIVVPPQVAILGAGRIAPQVVAVDGKPAVRRMLPLSLTFDHRAVTGGEAARFLAAVKRSLEGKVSR